MLTAQLEEIAKHLNGDLRKATKGLRMICFPTEIVNGDVLNRSWGIAALASLLTLKISLEEAQQ
jgi:hypothetical protein